VGFFGADGFVEDFFLQRERDDRAGFLHQRRFGRGGEERHEVIEHIGSIHNELGPLLNEAVATGRRRFVDGAGHGIDGAALRAF
jgi:hypothetical protein